MGNKCFRCATLAPPEIKAKISQAELQEILRNQLTDNFCRGKPFHVELSDAYYGLYSLEDMKRLLDSDKIDKLKYLKERFDCDDFAKALTGVERQWFASASGIKDCGSTFGIIHGMIYYKEAIDDPNEKEKGHALNFFVDSDKKVHIIEPQNDKIMPPTKRSWYYFVFV